MVKASKCTDEEERNDYIRKAVASTFAIDDAIPMAALVELVGRDDVQLNVKVDSDAGANRSEYDFSFSHKGANFDVQGTVFGSDL